MQENEIGVKPTLKKINESRNSFRGSGSEASSSQMIENGMYYNVLTLDSIIIIDTLRISLFLFCMRSKNFWPSGIIERI